MLPSELERFGRRRWRGSAYVTSRVQQHQFVTPIVASHAQRAHGLDVREGATWCGPVDEVAGSPASCVTRRAARDATS
jgi:hypothetical protein